MCVVFFVRCSKVPSSRVRRAALHALGVLVHVLDPLDDLLRDLVLKLELEVGVEARLFEEHLGREHAEGGWRSPYLQDPRPDEDNGGAGRWFDIGTPNGMAWPLVREGGV